MNAAKCDDLDYIHFLIAAQRVFSCSEAARCQPASSAAPSHDAFTRLLSRQPPDTEALWQEAQKLVPEHARQSGFLVLDDTTLDKPYARKMELVTRHWSGKHKRVVSGINLLTMLWTNSGSSGSSGSSGNSGNSGSSGNSGNSGNSGSSGSSTRPLVPCDFRLYDAPQDGLTKNDHFRAMLRAAKARGFAPQYVLFDSWYSGLDNLKLVRSLEWHFLTRFKSNRLVNPDKSGLIAVRELSVEACGQVVHVQGFGLVRVFQTVAPNGDVEHWATNDLEMQPAQRDELENAAWGIESYHRGLKQCCGVERAQMRSARAQRNHLRLCLQAFLRLETHRLQTGRSWYEAKTSIIREAVRHYIAHPLYHLPSTA